MSWQDYVDNQLIASHCVSKAAIAGHDGSVWAKTAGFEVSFSIFLRLLRTKKGVNVQKKKNYIDDEHIKFIFEIRF